MKKLITALLLTAISLGAAVKITIPEDVMARSFGKSHSFMLRSHGPSPIFSQKGYTFRVESYGYEISDEYYYDVPVYVGYNQYDPKNLSSYRIYTTKVEGPSIGLTVLTSPSLGSYVPSN